MNTKPSQILADVSLVDAIKAKVDELYLAMTFAERLAPDKRRQLQARGIGPKKLRSMSSRLVNAKEYQECMPPAFDLKRFEAEIYLATALNECLDSIDKMRDVLKDTFLAVANSAAESTSIATAHLQIHDKTPARMKRVAENLTFNKRRQALHKTSVVVSVPESSETPRPRVRVPPSKT